MAALERGWLPRGTLFNNPAVENACAREDDGAYKCVLKKGQLDKSVRDAVAYALNFQNLTNTPKAQKILNMTGDQLKEKGQQVLMEYFEKYRHSGATCDFGGIAMLVEENRTLTDDDSVLFSDDEYYNVEYRGPRAWVLTVWGALILFIGVLSGFVFAMRHNRRFNEKVRKSKFGDTIRKSGSRGLLDALHIPITDDEESMPLKTKN